MMKRSAITAAAVLLAVTLAGCAAPSEETQPSEPAPASSAPLVAESPEASASDGEKAFLDDVRASLPADTVIPDATDEQLLTAGAEACEAIANGEDTSKVSLIEGEPTNGGGYYSDSSAIIIAARASLCG